MSNPAPAVQRQYKQNHPIAFSTALDIDSPKDRN